MEEVKLVIAVDVPYEVELTATGIPLHEAKVEFCVHKQDVSYNFPAKMITDGKYMFTLTDAVKALMNKTHDYRLYVYYGNARFEADTGTFNLIDQKAFNAKINEGEKAPLSEKLLEKTKKKPKSESSKSVIEGFKRKPTPDATATPDHEELPANLSVLLFIRMALLRVKMLRPGRRSLRSWF